MTNTTIKKQIRQLEQLVKTAKNPKQKAQFKALLDKVKGQASVKPSPSPKPEPKPEPQPKITLSPKPEPQPKLTIEPQPKLTIETQPEPQPESESQEKPQEKKTTESPVFSAIGLIQGDVIFKDPSKLFGKIKIGENTFKISTLSRKRFNLTQDLEGAMEYNKPLLVYPIITHYPEKDKPHKISFQILAWGDKCLETWKLFEFKINGIWQFIPPCRQPVISIFKNKEAQRLEWIKNEETDILCKFKFLKATHLPVLWKDAPVKPFRFNPKAEKQGDSYFVQIGATFLPERKLWGFRELHGEPSKNLPKYLKLRKEDKAAALKELQKRKAERSKAKKESLRSSSS